MNGWKAADLNKGVEVPDLNQITEAISASGLLLHGAFHAEPDDGVPEPWTTVALVGNAGPEMWREFAPESEDGEDPLNAWSERIIGAIAEEFAGGALYPFGGPPYHPFQRWAKRAETVFSSPIGPLIHPEFGLWHAYRGALVFRQRLALPARDVRAHPCESCADRPCLTTCPVGAFSDQGYDVRACVDHLEIAAGANCLDRGCLARRACPVGRAYHYDAPQGAFHMGHFLRARQLAR